MRKILFLIFIFILMFDNIQSQTLRILTYNIRYDNPEDGVNQWSKRKEILGCQISFFEPDIFGIQEGLHHQVEYLDTILKEYSYLGIGRDDGKDKGEYSAIFYKNRCF